MGRETFDIALNANQEKPQSLSSFIVSNASGIAVGYDSTPAVLYQVAAGGEKTKVAEVTWNVELEYGKSGIDDVPTSLLLMLNKPVTKAGNYVLSFPRGYFKIGTGMLAGATAATDVEYTIAKDLEPYQVEFTPSGDDEVTSLSEVLVSFVDKDENSEYKYELGCDDMEAGKAYFFNEQRELVGTASMEFPASWDDAHSMNFILKNTISAPGKYTMVVPDGSFLYNVCGMYAEPNHTTRGGAEMSGNTDDDDDEGIYNNALIVKEFTVVAGSAENVTAEYSIKDNATVSKMESIKVTFKGATTVEAGNGMAWWKGPKNYLTNSEVSGTTVTLYPTEDMWDNSVIEKNGTYTLTLPEGYFVVNGNNWPAITITFTVDAAAGISNVEMTDANGQKVAYTLDGKRVNAAKKGVFIVNGKKVILK